MRSTRGADWSGVLKGLQRSLNVEILFTSRGVGLFTVVRGDGVPCRSVRGGWVGVRGDGGGSDVDICEESTGGELEKSVGEIHVKTKKQNLKYGDNVLRCTFWSGALPRACFAGVTVAAQRL